jgi:cytochrome c553
MHRADFEEALANAEVRATRRADGECEHCGTASPLRIFALTQEQPSAESVLMLCGACHGKLSPSEIEGHLARMTEALATVEYPRIREDEQAGVTTMEYVRPVFLDDDD